MDDDVALHLKQDGVYGDVTPATVRGRLGRFRGQLGDFRVLGWETPLRGVLEVELQNGSSGGIYVDQLYF